MSPIQFPSFRTPAAFALLLVATHAACAAQTKPPAAASTRSTSTTPPSTRPHDDRTARATADAMLAALVRVNGVPGMGAAVWRDGAVAWRGSAGMRDVAARTPVDGDTVFRLASVSKLFAATAAAKLAQDGRLDLDAPVTDALPWLRNTWAPISVRQLAAHVSGLAHYRPGDRALGKDHYASGRDAVRLFAQRPLLAPPGVAYEYSSWGYTLMGAVIEARAGTHFLDYVAQQVVPGLHIGADTGGRGDHVSRLYAIDGAAPRALPPTDMSYTWGGGGLAGTPAAVATFGGRVMRGDIVSPATWAAMRTPMRLRNGAPVAERDYVLGLGWRLGTDADGAAIAHHAGVTDGARSALVTWPGEQAAVSLLSNAEWVSSIESSAMLLAAPFRAAPAGLRAAACPLASVRYAGRVGDAASAGTARFRLVQGRCMGTLAPDAALSATFSNATAWPGRQLEVVSLSPTGDLARAALVTPYGLYDLRADAQGWQATLPKRPLRIAFLP